MPDQEIINQPEDGQTYKAFDSFGFTAEIKQCVQSKDSSGDNVYKLVLVTEQDIIMDIGKLPPDRTVKVRLIVNE